MLNKTKALSFIINNFKTLNIMEKKVYEAPEVTKVEIDFSDRIIAAGCALMMVGGCDPLQNYNS